jgi:hypothetical protein
MAAAASVRIVKSFDYRGETRLFSNRYYIGVNYPADDAHWATLINNVVAVEERIWPAPALGGVHMVEAHGYKPGTDVPVYSTTMNAASGNLFDNWQPAPGDCAAVVKWTTPDRSTKNHPIYCWNYFHAIGIPSGLVPPDNVQTQQLSAIQTYANDWIAGFSDGTRVYKRSRPSGNLCLAAVAEPMITHRDLPRA